MNILKNEDPITHNAPPSLLVLYSEALSSDDNLSYWIEKIEDQLDDRSSFGLVSVIENNNKKTAEKAKQKYSAWIKKSRAHFCQNCIGYAVVSSNSSVVKKYGRFRLKLMEKTLGCPCKVFNDLEDATNWISCLSGV